MAKEILILGQHVSEKGIDFTLGFLIPTTTRLVDGLAWAHTPTGTLTDWVDRFEDFELEGLDNGTIIFVTHPVFVLGPYNRATLEAAVRAEYRFMAPKVRQRYADVGESVGLRFDAEPGGR